MSEDQIRIARVSVNSSLPQLDRLFDYAIPERLLKDLGPGMRIKVPLRNSLVEGFVLEITDETDFEGTLLEVAELVSTVPLLTPDIYRLARAIADRQVGTVRDVLRLAIPPRQVRVEKAWQLQQKLDQTEGETQENCDQLQQQVHSLLEKRFGAEIFEKFADTQGRFALDVSTGTTISASGWLPNWSIELAALATLTLISGSSTIITVPDFRDLDRIEKALAEFLPAEKVLRLDSGQTNAERYRNYLRCQEKQAYVVLGNRSALYAPVHKLGSIVIWDDSDPLHTEPMAPYPNSRDIALIRQQQNNCRLLFGSLSRSLATQRLVEVGWLGELTSKAQTPKIILPSGEDVERGARIPSQVIQGLREGLVRGPVLVQVARPSSSAEQFPDDKLATASQTAHDLGRAFPHVPVILAEGERIVERVNDQPQLVISTRGAEPIADGGYRAIALLDGIRMMGRESLSVAEDCLRWWSNAAALATADSPVFLVDVPQEIGQAMASWRQDRFASRELSFRRETGFPPAVRVATLSGDRSVVNETRKKLKNLSRTESTYLDPVQPADEVSLLVKFDYRYGEALAELLREEVIRYAAARGKVKPRLRVRMDEPEARL